MAAAAKGHRQVVEFLLDRGVDPKAKDSHHWTALIWAADAGHQEIVDILKSS
jgi:ankyrin repeat protein